MSMPLPAAPAQAAQAAPAAPAAPRRRRRRGFTLAEVLVAFVILGGATLGLASFMLRYAQLSNEQSDRTLAFDLLTQRIEAIKGAPIYRTIDSTFHNQTEVWPSGNMYNGFTRRTWVVRTNTTQRDFMLLTVQVSGRRLKQPIKLTTVIARY